MVQLEGTQSNRQGIGATVQVQVGGQTQVRQLWPDARLYVRQSIRCPLWTGLRARPSSG